MRFGAFFTILHNKCTFLSTRNTTNMTRLSTRNINVIAEHAHAKFIRGYTLLRENFKEYVQFGALSCIF